LLKKRIIDEVKMIIAGRKVLKALRTNVHIKEALIDRYYQLIVEAEKIIKIFLQRSLYRLLFKCSKTFVATLYLESSELLKPT